MTKRIIIILTFLFTLLLAFNKIIPIDFKLIDLNNKTIDVTLIYGDKEKHVNLPLGTTFSYLNIKDKTISLDYILGDGEIYYIYNNDEEKVSINNGDIEELITLPGIGVKIAQNIIDYRNDYGLFENINEIKRVKGIGEKKYEQIKEYIIL